LLWLIHLGSKDAKQEVERIQKEIKIALSRDIA
jgi:hypothetical protein